jgi:lipopolysaccharide/colanic/teichoic acid biosynthesis glycosyltransferase
VQTALKRILDVTLAAAGLAATAPLQAVIAAAIRLDSDGPSLFRQPRIGRHGRPFTMLKFRTMAKAAPVEFNADGSTRVVAGDARVTRVGRILRGGLDELPQLMNVLRGDMSLVGPRPDFGDPNALYSPSERRKLEVRPGMTSLAAVLGRNELPWRQRVAIDLCYLEQWSLLLDLKIVVATLCLPIGVHPFELHRVVEGRVDLGAPASAPHARA